MKHRAFLKTSKKKNIFANNEDIGQKFLPYTYDHTLMLQKNNGIKRSNKVQGYVMDTLV